ncbi:MAG: MFS transporter [Desulfobacteraceae bacterium]|nr:MFS transporter [Desulfobacteraceae bacterium]
MPNRTNPLPAIIVIYTTAFFQGLVLIILAASAPVLKEVKGFSDAQYGLLFLPQIFTTLGGSLVGGALARRWGSKNLLVLSLITMVLSMALMADIVAFVPLPAAFFGILAAMALVGLGYGLGAGPLNAYPAVLFPEKAEAGITALHALIAFGLAAGPLATGPLIKSGEWQIYPLSLIFLGFSLLVGLAVIQSPKGAVAANEKGAATKGPGTAPRGFRSAAVLFCAIGVLYTLAEGTISNWLIIFLHEDRHVDPARASLALSIFWTSLAGSRLLISTLLLRIKAEKIWLCLPILIIVVLALLPGVRGPLSGALLFACAGAACSGFFPITVGLFTQRFAEQAAMAASLMIAAGMVGASFGSFIIGPLRTFLPLAHLYYLAILYPGAAFGLAVCYLVKWRHQWPAHPAIGS